MSDIIASLLRPAGELQADTRQGPVLGLRQESVCLFRGIPFAAPPQGKLRFLPPLPPLPRAKTLDCRFLRDSAVQGAELTPGITCSEDCLHLNLWAPAGAGPGSKLPVLVYIHGGGFSEGSPAKPVFDGTHFAENGVVQVNISYRLGALGFMAFEKVEAEHGFLGNLGLLDQIAALRWIQENIAFFGGNPACVTICGESAGAFSVSSLILSPLAKGLFHRAIMQSGNILGQPILAPMNPGCRGTALLQSRSYAASFRCSSLSGLRKLDAKLLSRGCAFKDNLLTPPRYNFWPVFDGRLLPENPYAALTRGPINEVDILAGFNSDEGTLFIPKNTTEEDYLQLCLRVFGANGGEVAAHFACCTGHTPASRARELIQMGLRFGSDVFADELSRRGKRVWLYNFNHRLPILDMLGLGITHAVELIFVFKTVPKLLLRSPRHRLVMEDTHARWLNFVKTGNPNEGLPVNGPWPAYTAQEKQILLLQEEPEAAPAPATQSVAFYRNLLWNH